MPRQMAKQLKFKPYKLGDCDLLRKHVNWRQTVCLYFMPVNPTAIRICLNCRHYVAHTTTQAPNGGDTHATD